MKCKNCGHQIMKVKTLNGWVHKCECEQGWHKNCAYTAEDSGDECECSEPFGHSDTTSGTPVSRNRDEK